MRPFGAPVLATVDTTWMRLLDAWREAPIYSARERAALAWTEAVTKISDRHVPDDVYDEARRHFSFFGKGTRRSHCRGDRDQCLESSRDCVSYHTAVDECEYRGVIFDRGLTGEGVERRDGATVPLWPA
jgi:hypothetical protein